jgi:hypothetical protein
MKHVVNEASFPFKKRKRSPEKNASGGLKNGTNNKDTDP